MHEELLPLIDDVQQKCKGDKRARKLLGFLKELREVITDPPLEDLKKPAQRAGQPKGK